MKVTIKGENGKNVEVELTQEQAREIGLAENENCTGWERVNNNEKYYFIMVTSEEPCYYFKEAGNKVDIKLYSKANYFSTEEKALEIIEIQTLLRQMKRFADNNNNKEMIKNHQTLYYLGYNELADELKIQYKLSWIAPTDKYISAFEVYFTSDETAQRAIEIFGDDYKRIIKKYFLKQPIERGL